MGIWDFVLMGMGVLTLVAVFWVFANSMPRD